MILSNNLIEVTDLVETLDDLGLGPATVFRSHPRGEDLFAGAPQTPGLVIFGLSLDGARMADILAQCMDVGTPAIVLDGLGRGADLLANIPRPFTTAHITEALRALGILD